MHPELKILITNLPMLWVAEFHRRATPYLEDAHCPVPIPVMFALVQSECLHQAGIRHDVKDALERVATFLKPSAKLYRRPSDYDLTQAFHASLRHVLSDHVAPELQVALTSAMARLSSPREMIRWLGTHFSDRMDQDIPFYIQCALQWHGQWCASQLPNGQARKEFEYEYGHAEVPLVVFMRVCVVLESSTAIMLNAQRMAPWVREVETFVASKRAYLSPTDKELLTITTQHLSVADVNNDFLKFFS